MVIKLFVFIVLRTIEFFNVHSKNRFLFFFLESFPSCSDMKTALFSLNRKRLGFLFSLGFVIPSSEDANPLNVFQGGFSARKTQLPVTEIMMVQGNASLLSNRYLEAAEGNKYGANF